MAIGTVETALSNKMIRQKQPKETLLSAVTRQLQLSFVWSGWRTVINSITLTDKYLINIQKHVATFHNLSLNG